MFRNAFGRIVPVVCALVVTAVAAGCGSHGYDSYVPSENLARLALETTLAHWQNGQLPGKIDTMSPAVQAVDSQWEAGEKLEKFEIVQEEPQSEGPRWFSVRLTMKDASEEQTVRFAILGKDPLWVYREDDYKKLAGL